jgi:hypothetical protein
LQQTNRGRGNDPIFNPKPLKNESKIINFKNSVMEIICMEEEAFYALIEQVVQRVTARQDPPEDRWLSQKEALRKLRIKSKTTLQKLRDLGKIRYSQPEKKIILYDLASINEYLEKNIKEPF